MLQVLGAPSHTHELQTSDQASKQFQLAPFWEACEVNSEAAAPPPAPSTQPTKRWMRAVGKDAGSCLQSGCGAERVTQQRLSLSWLPESLSLRFACLALPEVSPYSHPY